MSCFSTVFLERLTICPAVFAFVCLLVGARVTEIHTCTYIWVTFSRISMHWLMRSHGESWIEDVKQDTHSTAQHRRSLTALSLIRCHSFSCVSRRQGDLRALFRSLTKTNRSSMNLNCSMMSTWPAVTAAHCPAALDGPVDFSTFALLTFSFPQKIMHFIF